MRSSVRLALAEMSEEEKDEIAESVLALVAELRPPGTPIPERREPEPPPPIRWYYQPVTCPNCGGSLDLVNGVERPSGTQAINILECDPCTMEFVLEVHLTRHAKR